MHVWSTCAGGFRFTDKQKAASGEATSCGKLLGDLPSLQYTRPQAFPLCLTINKWESNEGEHPTVQPHPERPARPGHHQHRARARPAALAVVNLAESHA